MLFLFIIVTKTIFTRRETKIKESVILKLKSYETFAKVADGQATKIIIPSNLQDMTSVISVAKEIIKEKK